MKPVKYNPKAVGTTIDSLLDSFFNGSISDFVGSDYFMTSPSTNILENENEYKIELAVPGLNKEDFSINLDQDTLTIEAKNEEKTTAENEKYIKREFNYMAFKRNFTLPDTVNTNDIKAQYENGVLSIVLPKKEEAKPLPARIINIQ